MSAAGSMAAGGGRRAWVVDVEKTLKDADTSVEVSLWQRHCIYRVPACIKDLNPKAYRPQVVSLGPFHHGDPELRPMEEHKRRALRHLLRRAARPLEEFAAAVEDAADRLESAYMDLGAEWRGAGGRERFVEMMIVDGCFLLEVMRVAGAAGKHVDDYAPNDPIFSHHGVLYMMPYIRRDMLMLENQLPLLLLETLVAVETEKPPANDFINRMVLRFLSPSSPLLHGAGLALHPLDVYRRSMLYRQRRPRRSSSDVQDIIRSVVVLRAAGIQFETSTTDSLRDIRFQRGVLSMPPVAVDDSTEYMFLNMMAFERLHVGAGNDVTAYVFFMGNIIHSAQDVALLSSMGIIQNAVGTDGEVAKLFKRISKDIVLEPDSTLDVVQGQVAAYCREPWRVFRAKIVLTDRYFKNNPWALPSLTSVVVVLVATVLQTVFTLLQFFKDNGNGSPAAPAPNPK
ncbi:hypothetical protein ACP70R_008244 [Stipagrostis hirtigluma subsp. patula]